MLKITYQKWMQETNLGLMHPRPKALKALDNAIKIYDEARKKQQGGFTYSYSNTFSSLDDEIWVLIFDVKQAWWKYKGHKAGSGPISTWHRNQTGIMTELETTLNVLVPPRTENGIRTAEHMLEWRKGTAWTLSKLLSTQEVQSGVQLGVQSASALYAGYSFGSTLEEGIVRKAAKDGFIPSTARAAVAEYSSFVSTVVDAIRKALTDFAAELGEDGVKALNSVLKKLEDIAVRTLSAPMKVVESISPYALDSGTLAANVYSAYNKANVVRNAKSLTSGGGVHVGVPKQVVSALVEQINTEMWLSGGKALLDAGKLALTATGWGAAKAVATSVVSMITYCVRLFNHYRTHYKLKRIFAESRDIWRTELWRDANAYQEWFSRSIDHLPLLASYIVCLPMTGSYYGFLSTTCAKDSSLYTIESLERNLRAYEDVKKQAREFIVSSNQRLYSDDDVLKPFLQSVRGAPINIGDFKYTQDQWERNTASGVFWRGLAGC